MERESWNITVNGEEEEKHPESSSPVCVVGIGASAGGLEALEVFFDHMLPDSGMSFVVVQHLSPDYKSLMSEILSKYTTMPIWVAEHEMEILSNHVYLIPPRKTMTIRDGKLQLADAVRQSAIHLSIDDFFVSLAAEYGNRAVGVVLSGTGTDGSKGVIEIKKAGGLVIVQDGQSAKFDGMPSSAKMTGKVDEILNPKDMSERLIQHIRSFGVYPLAGEQERMSTEQFIQLIFEKIKEESGIDFTYYKRNSVLRRIERRMAMNNVASVQEYMTYLEEHRDELTSLRKDLLIGVTNFFRDAEAFQIIYDQVLPRIFEKKSYSKEIRVWVAGCSTGEEAYSIAILLKKYAQQLGDDYNIKIFATDLDKESIEYASQGIYSESNIHHLSEEDVERFFIRDDDMFHVSKDIRKMVIFAPQNIIKDPPFRNLDMVTCRNMLIYLQPEMQVKVLSLFHFALNPEGFLFLGPSETLGRFANQFEAFDRRWNIFCHKSGKMSSDSDSDSQSFSMEGRGSGQHSYRRTAAAAVQPREQVHVKRSGDLYTMLAEEHISPGMVVNHHNDVIHLVGAINEYLVLSQGKPSWNLYKMIDQNVAVTVSTGIQKVRDSLQNVVYPALRIHTNQGDRLIDLHIRPFSRKNKAYDKYVLLLFEDPQHLKQAEEVVMEPVHIDNTLKMRIFELEQELQRSEESLQATVEELETSNEELQATNEELVAANEELQSANEELQSVNEELVTVNTEFQFKIQELTDVNNDMNNFLGSTRIGTIFLDKRMCIRRFTPAITKEINLMDVDYGRPIQHISHHFRYVGLVDDAQHVLKTLEPLEKEIQSQDGTWYSMRILPYRTEDNFTSGVVLTFVNITDLKAVNEELLKLSYAIEQSPSMTIITDVSGKIEYANPKFTEVTGYALQEAKGRDLGCYSYSEFSMKDVFKTSLDGETWKGEILSYRKNGEEFWESVKIIPITDKQGQIIHFVKLSEDISERKNAEEMLRKTEMLSAVGQLAAGIAHEIRNPLTALKGFTKLLSKKEDGNAYIEIMLTELNRIEQIVSELLVLAKPQAIEFSEHELEPIIQDVIMLLETQAIMNNVEITVMYEQKLKVMCVENQLKQVFINVLKNAIEAMPGGGKIDISVTLNENDNIVISFVDNGAGIPEAKLARIGEPFYSTKDKGTGLGLMVSYKIIQNHQGTIHIESEVGRGTGVIIQIPTSNNQARSLLPVEGSL
ncbi:CheR family methyltransferase [Paenibacillus urinalis]|uniref:Chemotaxis protein CheB n=1 Tax=Paenibacillus urinalis TaxID=521520 RepID=A0AAX3N4D3_9BACL|nr:CheR family methyltransferase [Paenibacillus urinalis]WDH83482.1 chemotaxis protein CheB [Paenibacillus urinalis]